MKDITSSILNSELGFDSPESFTPDTDQMFREATEARKNSIESSKKTSSAPSDLASALETFNNVFKAFNSIVEMNSGVNGDASTSEAAPQVNPVTDTPDDPASNNTETMITPDSTEEEQIAEGSMPEGAHTDSVPPEKQNEKHVTEANLINDPECIHSRETFPSRETSKMIQQLENEMLFIPAFEDDLHRIDQIRMIKQRLSTFRSYDEMIRHILVFKQDGNFLDAEMFFLFHCIYTLDHPEKYHEHFRRNMFSDDYYFSAGRAKDIDKFLKSFLSRVKEQL